MSTPSIRASIYSCSHPLINGENATRLQSARTFDPFLNVASHTPRYANDVYSGRPAHPNSGNGWDGLLDGFAGLQPSDYMNLETALRQVEFQENIPSSTFYDTIEGANRAHWYSQFAGASGTTCGLYNGPDAYTSTPYQSNQNGQPGLTSVDRRKYLQALHKAYQQGYGSQYTGQCAK